MDENNNFPKFSENCKLQSSKLRFTKGLMVLLLAVLPDTVTCPETATCSFILRLAVYDLINIFFYGKDVRKYRHRKQNYACGVRLAGFGTFW